MVLGRVVTTCAALALLAAAGRAHGGDGLTIGMGGRGEDETRRSADEPAIAAAQPGPEAAAEFHSSPGDGLAVAAARDLARAVPGSRTGALARSILVPGYGQLYNGQRLKGAVLFGAEIALLSTALAFHLAGDSALSVYNREARSHVGGDLTGRIQQLHDSAQARYRVRDGLLLAATGIWVVSMADAYLSGGRMQPLLDVPRTGRRSRELAPLAAIRPGQAIFGFQGRF
jgi:hypothetical protein